MGGVLQRPKTIAQQRKEHIDKLLTNATPEEKTLDEVVEVFLFTGIEHELGPDWIGQLNFYCGFAGDDHRYRYDIRWIDPWRINRNHELLTAQELKEALVSKKILIMKDEEIDMPPVKHKRQFDNDKQFRLQAIVKGWNRD